VIGNAHQGAQQNIGLRPVMPNDETLDEPWVPEELKVVADQVKRNEVPPKITVRQLLQYFGFQRRGFIKSFIVQEALDAVGIATDPPFLDVWIDAEISFIPKKTEEHPSTAISATKKDPIALEEPIELTGESYDPTYRIGLLEAANQRIVRVNPDDDLTIAVTRMLNNDYSQLPVMRTDRNLKGIISWATIGSRMALRQQCKWVRDCMDTHVQVVNAAASLFSVIPIIVEHDYVLVSGNDNKITGIVTASDLSLQFQQLSGPFLLLREIEQHVRKLISSKLSIDDLKLAQDPSDQKEVRSVNDLNLGEYVRVFQNPDLWQKLGLDGLSRSDFSTTLDDVRAIRNDVMHFDPDPLEPEHLKKLTSFARFLQKLQEIRSGP
jgi:predicted transcriptional regulator